MEFKDRLRLLREECKISVTKFAAYFNKSESAVRMWEIGRSKPDADMLIEIAHFFNCSVDYLLGVDNNRNKEMLGISNKELGHLASIILSYHNYSEIISSLESIFNTNYIDNIDQQSVIKDCILILLQLLAKQSKAASEAINQIEDNNYKIINELIQLKNHIYKHLLILNDALLESTLDSIIKNSDDNASGYTLLKNYIISSSIMHEIQ